MAWGEMDAVEVVGTAEDRLADVVATLVVVQGWDAAEIAERPAVAGTLAVVQEWDVAAIMAGLTAAGTLAVVQEWDVAAIMAGLTAAGTLAVPELDAVAIGEVPGAAGTTVVVRVWDGAEAHAWGEGGPVDLAAADATGWTEAFLGAAGWEQRATWAAWAGRRASSPGWAGRALGRAIGTAAACRRAAVGAVWTGVARMGIRAAPGRSERGVRVGRNLATAQRLRVLGRTVEGGRWGRRNARVPSSVTPSHPLVR